MGDDLLTAIGLMLTQLRVARRALEDIERSTARYNSFAFASALSAGASFGAPPMFGGALKVWIVNINDLAPGAGDGFLEQLLGGLGRFLGGLGGGALGGILGGWKLPDMIGQIQKIADTVERILIRLGVDLSGAAKKDTGKKTEEPGLLDTLNQWIGVMKAFTGLFQAGAGKPEEAQKTADSLTPGAERWLAIVKSASELMNGIDRVVQGLIFLVPIVVGALAELITRLDTIKLAILDLLQFLLQELFILRGVLLVTIYDTLSAAAKLASSILGILSVAMNSIAASIFRILQDIFDAAIATIKFLSDGLQNTVDTVARWLVDTIGDVLFSIGDSIVFREIVHIVDVLPAILPPLVYAIRGEDAFKALDTAALTAAAGKTVAGPAAPGTPGARRSAGLVSPPLISTTLTPPADFATLSSTVGTALSDVNAQLKNTFGTATGALNIMSQQLDDAAKDKTFTDGLKQHTDEVRANSKTLADALKLAQDQAIANAKAERPKTGLDVIAKAYEDWLAGNGLQSLLTNVTEYFKKSAVADVFKDKAVGPSAIDRPRATVDIQDVVIELEPPAPPQPGPKEGELIAKEPGLTRDDLLKMLAELSHELTERGFKFAPGSLIMQI
jgi:hypothetical protein